MGKSFGRSCSEPGCRRHTSIKASASSLRQHDVKWSPQDEAAFLETIEDETDRLTALVSNLLDMSRLQAGVLQPELRPVNLEEVVPAAIASLGERAYGVVVDVPETLGIVPIFWKDEAEAESSCNAIATSETH